jgi:hypothetical protein
MATLEALKKSLPNFPDEVLRDWLLPYAMTEGWPPSDTLEALPERRWRYLLRNQPLGYWRSISWQQVKRHISIYDLSAVYQDIMVQMTLGAVTGQRNLYSTSIPDLKQRFYRIVEHIGAHGVLPKTPALLEEDGALSVLDGNHRMAAYFYCYGYFKLEVEGSLQLNVKEIQSYWVGKSNPSPGKPVPATH